MRAFRRFGVFSTCGLAVAPAVAQQPGILLTDEPVSIAAGWAGFADVGFLASSFLTLVLAAVLGAAIGYHPRHVRATDTLQDVELPRVCIQCALIGALIGILVVNYGLVVGFVVFGIGGLIRFRTILHSPDATGHVIFVTLIGLSCGLNLPHVAVLAAVFSFVLIYLLDARPTYQVVVKGLSKGNTGEAATAYRQLLEGNGCRVVSERKNPNRARFRIIFRTPRGVTREQVENLIESEIAPDFRGVQDWEVF